MLLWRFTQPFTKVLDFCLPNPNHLIRRCCKEVSDCLEASFVSNMRRMRRDDELHWPRCFASLFGIELVSELGKLANKNLLHLGMQVSLRFLNEDEMQARRVRLGAEHFVEPDKLKKDEDQIAYTQPVVGLRKMHTAVTRISDFRMVREESLNVERCLRFEF